MVPNRQANVVVSQTTLAEASSVAAAHPQPAVPISSEVAIQDLLIVNADDWGRTRRITDRTLDCIRYGTVNAVSAMVFMEDSERGAEIGSATNLDAGLHLNLTTPFTSRVASAGLRQRQERIVSYLCGHRLSQVLFHPGLIGSMEYVVRAQIDEFHRLFGPKLERVDGHHHMHLCANVLLAQLLPSNTVVRRNFSFQSDEKSLTNRLYRKGIDRLLATRHVLTDYFFNLVPLEPEDRLRRIFSIAKDSIVELETHPGQTSEYRFLMGEEFARLSEDVQRGTFQQWRLSTRTCCNN